jgi:hypothetical protein
MLQQFSCWHNVITFNFNKQIHTPIFRGKNGINGDSAENCHLMNEDCIGEMVIPPGINNSGTRNPHEKWDSA